MDAGWLKGMVDLTGESRWKWLANFHNCCGCCILCTTLQLRSTGCKWPWERALGLLQGWMIRNLWTQRALPLFGPRDWPIAAHHLRHWSQAETLKGLQGARTLEEQPGQQRVALAVPQFRECNSPFWHRHPG